MASDLLAGGHSLSIEELEPVNIVMTSDSAFIPHTATVLASVAENAGPALGGVRVVLANVPQRTSERFARFGKHLFGGRFSTLNLDLDGQISVTPSGHISSATFARFFLGETTPPEWRSVLYIDSDTLVLRDLSVLGRFAHQTFRSNPHLPLLAVPEEEVPSHMKGAFKVGEYFNAGVLLINLSYWRENSVSRDLVVFTEEIGQDGVWWSQDPLNLRFKGQWEALDKSFNRIRPKEIDGESYIVHFAGSVKPWHFGSGTPYGRSYRTFRRSTPFPNSVPTKLLRGLWRLAKGLRTRAV